MKILALLIILIASPAFADVRCHYETVRHRVGLTGARPSEATWYFGNGQWFAQIRGQWFTQLNGAWYVWHDGIWVRNLSTVTHRQLICKPIDYDFSIDW